MKYCILSFVVTYEDGERIHRKAPYRGESWDINSLVQFIKGYFAGTKAYHDEDIIVEVLKEYKNPQEWLTEIKNLETFKYLQKVINFAGDLMAKYFPNEQ